MFEFVDNTYIIAQVFGLCALTCCAFAWQLKNARHIILFYVPIAILWGIQYYLLGAYTGALICAISILKDGSVGLSPARYAKYICYS